MFNVLISAWIAASSPLAPPEVQTPTQPSDGVAITDLQNGEILVSADRFVFHPDGSVTAESGPEAPLPSQQWIEVTADAVEISEDGNATFVGNPQIWAVAHPPISRLTLDGQPVELTELMKARDIQSVRVDRFRQTLNVETRR